MKNITDCYKCFEYKSLYIIRIFVSIGLLAAALIFNIRHEIKLFLFIISYLAAGADIIINAVQSIAKRKVFDENFLMMISSIGAFCIREYPEAVMVMILYQIGEYFQHNAVESSRKSITSLQSLRPEYANLVVGGTIIKKIPDEINIGDIIVVSAGEKIPLDGIIVEGHAFVDTSALTGESVFKMLQNGATVLSGYINTNGYIKIKVTKTFKSSAISKILELVENSAQKKSKSEKFISKFAKYYTPAVIMLAIITATVPIMFFAAAPDIWVKRALTFLVISCPCALVISVPLSFFAGIGGASGCGILIKGGNYLEKLAQAGTFLFDKTGTLTKGVFKTSQIIPEKHIMKDELLYYAASAEYYSNHPIANSIKTASKKIPDLSEITNIEEYAGMGISAVVCGKRVLAGSGRLMDKFNIPYKPHSGSLICTIVYIALDGIFAGTIIISDEIKEDTHDAICRLKKTANKIIMLTGDSKSAAKKTASELGIDEFYYELLPEDKVNIVENLIKEGNGNIIFIGDGINDAPVLKRADIGIAMGAAGSDASIEAADIVIMDDKISKIAAAVKISKKTMSIVRQNIIFAIGMKLLFLLLGAFGYITIWGAVFADTGIALCSILNSLQALQIKNFIKE